MKFQKTSLQRLPGKEFKDLWIVTHLSSFYSRVLRILDLIRARLVREWKEITTLAPKMKMRIKDNKNLNLNFLYQKWKTKMRIPNKIRKIGIWIQKVKEIENTTLGRPRIRSINKREFSFHSLWWVLACDSYFRFLIPSPGPILCWIISWNFPDSKNPAEVLDNRIKEEMEEEIVCWSQISKERIIPKILKTQ